MASSRQKLVFFAGLIASYTLAIDGWSATSLPLAPGSVPVVSDDGSTLVFSTSEALVPEDDNALRDIYAYDIASTEYTLISKSSSGAIADGDSTNPNLSGDGRLVCFSSTAENIVPRTLFWSMPSPTDIITELYAHDRVTGITRWVSSKFNNGIFTDGTHFECQLSADGRYVVWTSDDSRLVANDTNSFKDIFRHDLATAVTERVSVAADGGQAMGRSSSPSVSNDGRYISYISSAPAMIANSSLVLNGRQLYRRDMTTQLNRLISVFTTVTFGTGGASFTIEPLNDETTFADMSSDGQSIVFNTSADNLRPEPRSGYYNDVYLWQSTVLNPVLVTDSTVTEQLNVIGGFQPALSANARYISYQTESFVDRNKFNVLYDTLSGYAEQLNVPPESVDNVVFFKSESAMQSMSADGRYVGFIARQAIAGSGLLTHSVLRDRGQECDTNAAANKRTLEPNTWLLISVPCVPPAASTVSDIFGDDITGDLFTTWAMFRWDAFATPPAYVPMSEDDPIISGQGYWIQQITGSPVTLDLPVGSREATTDPNLQAADCTSALGCVSLPLSGTPNNGVVWNLLGNPNTAANSGLFDDLSVSALTGSCASGTGCSIDEGFDAGIIFNTFFHYDGTGYSERNTGTSLGAWEGYWVGELPGAVLNDVEIHVGQ